VCVSVYVCDHFLVARYLQKLRVDFDEIFWRGGMLPTDMSIKLDFGGGPDSSVDPGSFSRILYY